MNLKQLFYIISFFTLSLCFLNCSTYERVNITKEYDSDRMIGHCFASEITTDTLEGIYQKAFILEYHPPIFKTEKLTISEEELVKYQYKDSLFRIITVFGHVKYLYADHKLKQRYQYKKDKNLFKGFIFCLVEVPSKYEFLTEDKLENIAFTIEQKKIKKEPYISKKHVKNKPKILKKNQYYYEAGYYTVVEEKILGSDPGAGSIPAKQIKKALNKLGYDLEVNYIMDDETKAALLDLQKKNGLPEGNLNMETLRFLGLQL